MTPGARYAAAIEILDAIEAGQQPADQIMSLWFRERRFAGSKDRMAIGELTYGILRRRSQLDWWLTQYGLKATSRLRVLAALTLIQKMSPDSLQEQWESGSHAPSRLTPSEKNLLAAMGEHELLSADQPSWVSGNYPQWLDPLLRQAFPVEADKEIAALNTEASVDLRVNTLKSDVNQAIRALEAEGLHPQPMPYSPIGLRLAQRAAVTATVAFRDGLIEVQDEGSQLAALLVAARPGLAVLDLCAGAGGKTLALAAVMQNKGRLVATDLSAARLTRAKHRLRRAGVHVAECRALDSSNEKWLKRQKNKFDRVIVDAPCSGSGTWRRNPDRKWHFTPEELTRLIKTQSMLIAQGARAVKPGGRLIYAVCSFLDEEGPDRIHEFLKLNPEFTPLSGSSVWQETLSVPYPKDGQFLRLSPGADNTDGFFIAILKRKQVLDDGESA